MPDAGRGGGETERVKLWDPGIRIFHWALAVAFATSYLLGEFGPAIMTWHFWSGYVICGLLVFRLVWGVAGPRPARFASFVKGPRAVAAYARDLFRREPTRYPGHNPLGGLSVIAMLVLLAAQVATGLISDPEDYINVGPLAGWVDIETSRTANAWHARISTALLALVVLHVAVIVFYRLWKGENLVRPMITGWKEVRRNR